MINSDYKYTKVSNTIEEITPLDGSTYLYGYSTEDRSHEVDSLISRFPEVHFIEIILTEDKDIVTNGDRSERYNLRSSKDIGSLISKYKSKLIYIDVTGLNTRVAASLLNNSIRLSKDDYLADIRVIYAEPNSYKIQMFKSASVLNDLSEKIDGIEPLPGIASIIPDEEDMIFVACLGFEGGRFTHIVESIQPPDDNIIPVVGVPGYRIEYPFVAIWGNRQPLEATKSWQNMEFAAANSLVDVYLLLKRILEEHPKSKLKIAPIGTKPHAIGAILFAIKNPNKVEIVYDNPKRKTQRTQGCGLLIECCVTKLLKDN